jgi:hypothetical protein
MTSEEFRRRAADCLRRAQDAANERTKALWLNMALIWFDRAENPQKSANARITHVSDRTMREVDNAKPDRTAETRIETLLQARFRSF